MSYQHAFKKKKKVKIGVFLFDFKIEEGKNNIFCMRLKNKNGQTATNWNRKKICTIHGVGTLNAQIHQKSHAKDHCHQVIKIKHYSLVLNKEAGNFFKI